MRISVRHIQEVVAADFSVPLGMLFSRHREHPVSHPRQVAMYLARKLTTQSYPNLGRIFGVDHTTVLHGVRAVEKRMAIDPVLAIKVEARKLLLECETFDHSTPLIRILRQIPDASAQKTVIMAKWQRKEITPSHATHLIRTLELENA